MTSISNLFALDRLVDPNLSSGNGTTIFTTLTSAISAAVNGDNIIVVSSTYNEAALTITKSLKIAPQTPGSIINFNANINITGFAGMNLEFIGINIGVYSFLANAPTSGSATSRANVTFIGCTATNINFNQNYYNLNLIKCNVSSVLTFKYGKITYNNLGNCYLNDEPSTNLTTDERIFIVANTINNETQLLNDDYVYHFTNNTLKNLRVQKWILDVNKTNYITNNEFANNCQLHFATIIQNAPFNCSGSCNYDALYAINSYNFKYENNNFIGTVYFTNKNSGSSGGTASNHYSAFRYGNDYFSSISCNYCLPNILTYQSQFPNPNSSGFFSWTYNGNIIPCTVPSGSQPLSLTRIAGPTNIIDGGNPNHEYYDIDLTINDRGKFGGPYTLNNYSATNNSGFSFVNDLSMPTDLFPSTQVNIKASGYHSNQGASSQNFYELKNAEYFFGVFDPGQGSGNQIVTEDGSFDNSFESVFRNQATWTISSGPTLFNIRFKDANNNWGPLFKKTVFPYGDYPNAKLIQQGDTINVCPNGNVTLTYNGPNGYTPTWFNGSNNTTITFSATTIGYYSVSSTLGNSTYYDSIYVGFLQTPSPNINPSGSLLVCSSSNITLSTQSSANTTFQWYYNNNPISGATSINYLPTQLGNYFVRATSTITGCQGNSSITSLSSTPTITATGSTTLCSGQSVTLSSNFTTGNLWSNGATTQSITVTQSGNYSVTVTNGSCSATSNVIVVNGAPTISAGGPTTFCSGGSVTLTSSSATGNTWSTGATTQSISVSQSGSYSVNIFNGSCSATSNTITITVSSIPSTPTISASGPTTFCSGGSLTLTSSSATGNTWSTGATTQSITVTQGGNYTVSVSNGSCSAASNATSVVVNSTPATPTISASGPTTFCSGGSLTLTSSSATGNTWSTGAISQSIIVNQSGNYTVSVSNGNCSSTSIVKSVTVNPVPATPTISTSGPTTFCSGGSATLTSSSSTGNTWSTGATTQSITVTQGGNYTVSVSNGSCSAASNATSVVVNSTPATPTISASGPTTFCSGGSLTLTSSSATGNTWSTGAISQSIIVNQSGNYTVSVSNGNCSSTSNMTTVTVNPIPATPTISASGPTTFCSGGSVILTSSISTGNTWSTGATTQSITVTQSGNYTVSVSNGNCSNSSAVTQINVNPIPNSTINASGPTTFCSGGSVTLTSTSSSGNTWSTGVTTQSIIVNQSGSYQLTVSDGQCSSTSIPLNVIVNSIPNTPVISSIGNTTFCQGDSVLLASSYFTGNTWSNGQIVNSIYVTQSGFYTVQYIDNNGCLSTSNPFAVTVLPLPQVNVVSSGSTTLCQGESVTLTCTPASSYFWSNGSLNQSIIVNQSGSYSVNVTGSNGCSNTSSPTVVVVNPNTSSSLNQNAVNSFTLNGQTYSQSGTYTQVIPNLYGCDSTITLNLTISSSSLHVNSANFSVYPNPTFDKITVNAFFDSKQAFSIIDGVGRILFSGELFPGDNIIALQDFSRGTYSIVIVGNSSPIQIIKE